MGGRMRNLWHLLLSVQPSRALVDEKFSVRVQNALPAQWLTVHALLHSEDGDDWEAFGHYVTDAGGDVNVTKDPSLGGTYVGVEPMGLLWSQRPVPGSRPGLRFTKRDVQTPTQVRLSVYQGHQSEGFMDRAVLASVMVERWYMAPGVRRVNITEGGVTGTLFLPPGPGPFPGLLDLWGGGGLVEYRSALLASHGFASLTLNYLKPVQVKNEYFEDAYRVLQQHSQVCRRRIGLVGLSSGSSMALRTIYSNVIQPRCLVCLSATHVQPVGGTIADFFYKIEENLKKSHYNEENQLIGRNVLLPMPTDTSKKVDVGRLQCPLLLVVGEDDQSWPASESADDMREMMERAGNSHLLTVLSYPRTGHLIEPPYSPHCRASKFNAPTISPNKFMILWGGEVAPHSHAQEDAWRKMLDFLRENLYCSAD
ncbi:peroxisomal succinyl-coenzyme A thioesterase-like [Myripristis murdjan]|uniref:peroxisomal succinyl-coenzyme A thioesterase-like n=1 Tax=Myripristis murdjan TaxID=586833 RepID=UPI001175EE94|nr:peroxisomal succinyl-coenzyme A thioesterase-like [Myripristis murdjan]